IPGQVDSRPGWRSLLTLRARNDRTCPKGTPGPGTLRGAGKRRPRSADDEINLRIPGSQLQFTALRNSDSSYTRPAPARFAYGSGRLNSQISNIGAPSRMPRN